jgi:hypothetical protein
VRAKPVGLEKNDSMGRNGRGQAAGVADRAQAWVSAGLRIQRQKEGR